MAGLIACSTNRAKLGNPRWPLGQWSHARGFGHCVAEYPEGEWRCQKPEPCYCGVPKRRSNYGSNVSAFARIRTMSNYENAPRRKGRERRSRGGLRPALTPLRSTPVKPAPLFMFLHGSGFYHLHSYDHYAAKFKRIAKVYGTYQPVMVPSRSGCTTHSRCIPSSLRCTLQPSRSQRTRERKSPS